MSRPTSEEIKEAFKKYRENELEASELHIKIIAYTESVEGVSNESILAAKNHVAREISKLKSIIKPVEQYRTRAEKLIAALNDLPTNVTADDATKKAFDTVLNYLDGNETIKKPLNYLELSKTDPNSQEIISSINHLTLFIRDVLDKAKAGKLEPNDIEKLYKEYLAGLSTIPPPAENKSFNDFVTDLANKINNNPTIDKLAAERRKYKEITTLMTNNEGEGKRWKNVLYDIPVTTPVLGQKLVTPNTSDRSIESPITDAERLVSMEGSNPVTNAFSGSLYSAAPAKGAADLTVVDAVVTMGYDTGVVTDGLGHGGDIGKAAANAAKHLARLVESTTDPQQLVQSLPAVFLSLQANQKTKNLAGNASGVVSKLFDSEGSNYDAVVTSVGDCMAFVWNPEKETVEMLTNARQFQMNIGSWSPLALTEAPPGKEAIQNSHVSVEPGAFIFLMSDGVWEHLPLAPSITGNHSVAHTDLHPNRIYKDESLDVSEMVKILKKVKDELHAQGHIATADDYQKAIRAYIVEKAEQRRQEFKETKEIVDITVSLQRARQGIGANDKLEDNLTIKNIIDALPNEDQKNDLMNRITKYVEYRITQPDCPVSFIENAKSNTIDKIPLGDLQEDLNKLDINDDATLLVQWAEPKSQRYVRQYVESLQAEKNLVIRDPLSSTEVNNVVERKTAMAHERKALLEKIVTSVPKSANLDQIFSVLSKDNRYSIDVLKSALHDIDQFKLEKHNSTFSPLALMKTVAVCLFIVPIPFSIILYKGFKSAENPRVMIKTTQQELDGVENLRNEVTGKNKSTNTDSTLRIEKALISDRGQLKRDASKHVAEDQTVTLFMSRGKAARFNLLQKEHKRLQQSGERQLSPERQEKLKQKLEKSKEQEGYSSRRPM